MSIIKETSINTTQYKPIKGDLLTRMFEEFGIKVIDATPKKLRLNKKKARKNENK